MAVGLVDYNTMVSIGDAIRLKLETDQTYAPYEMADAIKSIQNEGGGTGFGDEYIVGISPFHEGSADQNAPLYINNYIYEVVITNELPSDCYWSAQIDWSGMSKGNVYAFQNNPQPPYPDATYTYPYTFGFCLEDGNEDSKLSILTMHNMFYYHSNLKQPLPVGNYCLDMSNCYASCANLIGPAVCGDNVQNMCNTYGYCSNLIGEPICGKSVTNMYYAYYNCIRLNGSPAVGPNVIDGSYAYYNCFSLIGDGICPESLQIANYMYFNCRNLMGTGYIGGNLINCDNMYGNTGITRLVVNDGVTKLHGAPYPNGMMEELVLPDSLLIMDNLLFNLRSSIDAVVPNNVIIAYNAYTGASNLKSLVCPDSVINAAGMYSRGWSMPINNQELHPIVGNRVVQASNMFYGQNSLTGSPIIVESIRNMSNMYTNCSNLTGSPVFPENIGDENIDNLPFNMNEIIETAGVNEYQLYGGDWYIRSNGDCCYNAYSGCSNLNGSPIVPRLMNNFSGVYYGCTNLTGNPVGSANLINADYLYCNCFNLTGSVNMGEQLLNMRSLFQNAYNVSSVYLPNNEKVMAYSYCSNAFNRNIWDTRLNVVVDNRDTFNTFRTYGTSIFGCSIGSESTSTDLSNIEIEGEDISVVRYAYNSARNYYLYCTE